MLSLSYQSITKVSKPGGQFEVPVRPEKTFRELYHVGSLAQGSQKKVQSHKGVAGKACVGFFHYRLRGFEI
jgi:hypothetical protein